MSIPSISSSQLTAPAVSAAKPQAGGDGGPSLPDGILDGAVYGALTTVLLGPLVAVRSSNKPLALLGTIALNSAIFAGLDACMTDKRPEALDQYLRF